jgi:uncharacterized protein (TIGR00369 family)
MNLIADLDPGLTGLEQLQELMARGGQASIGRTMAFALVDAGEGWAEFEGVPGLHVYNPIGTVHGGYAAALLDSACGCAVHSRLRPGQGYTTLELKVAYHKAMTDQTGPVRAQGQVISIGGRAAFAEATLKGVDGKLYASATSTLLVFER